MPNCPSYIVSEVERLNARGVSLSLMDVSGQCYARVSGIPGLVPPWDRESYSILISIPLASGAALDAFYLELPYSYQGATHPRVSGNIVEFDKKTWQLVSWHYPDGRPWVHGKDDLDTHISHCKGFLLNRGAINEIR